MVRPLLITGAALGVSILTVFAGCSSSSTGGNGGTSSSSGGTSSSSGGSSSGGSSSSGSSGGTDSGKKDGSGSSSGGASSSGGDSSTASTCPYTATFTPGTYPASTAHSGACAAADVTSFVNACGDKGNQNACDTWQQNNVAGVTDGSAGTACGNCIFKPDNSGAAFVSTSDGGQGYFSMNFGGCIQLSDPTNGPACQPVYDALTDCDTFLCGDCAATSYPGCASTINGAGGPCNTQDTAFQTSCATDFGDGGPTTIATKCDPGSLTNPATQDPTFQLIIGLICGSADGG